MAYFLTYSREDKYGTLLFQKVIAHIWIGQITVGTSVYLYSKYRNIPSFLRQWENYKIKYGGLTLSFMKQHVFRRIVRINIVVVIFMLVSGLVWIIAQAYPLHRMGCSFYKRFKNRRSSRGTLGFLHLYAVLQLGGLVPMYSQYSVLLFTFKV